MLPKRLNDSKSFAKQKGRKDGEETERVSQDSTRKTQHGVQPKSVAHFINKK